MSPHYPSDALGAASRFQHHAFCFLQLQVPADVRREVVVAERRSDGSIVEGVLDLAYRADNEWIVVDFKTNEVVPTDSPYAVQLRLYVDAVQRATRGSTRSIAPGLKPLARVSGDLGRGLEI